MLSFASASRLQLEKHAISPVEDREEKKKITRITFLISLVHGTQLNIGFLKINALRAICTFNVVCAPHSFYANDVREARLTSRLPQKRDIAIALTRIR
jgi:hypothetical protein